MKNILITGGSRGIGRATALLAASRGWSVAINYAGNRIAAEETAEEVRKVGGQAMTVRGDVSVESEVVAMFGAAEREIGALDGVVINAGIVAPLSKLADMETDRIRRMFDINIFGAFLCAREAARRLPEGAEGKGRSIVIVSSKASVLGSPNEFIDYASSKAAMDALTIGLAKELAADDVRVNAIRPGPIETDIHASSGQPDRAARVGATTPLGRAGRPEEAAEAIIWLLSDAASYVTGTLLDVAGGR